MNESKTLTTEQINFIHDVLRGAMRKDWIDARYEMVDHISSSIEATWVGQPDLPFREAYYQAIDKLNGGQDIEKLINAKKRAIHWSHFRSYWSFMTDVRSFPVLFLIFSASILFAYIILLNDYVLDFSTYTLWAILGGTALNSCVDFYRFRLHRRNKTQTLRYHCYTELFSVDFILVMPLLFLTGSYPEPSLLYKLLSILNIFIVVSFMGYRISYFRSKMLEEIHSLRSMETQRKLDHA